MSADDRKTEPPFGLDMDFGEALERFIGTRPKDVDDSVERSKQKKPPGENIPRRLSTVPARSSRRRRDGDA